MKSLDGSVDFVYLYLREFKYFRTRAKDKMAKVAPKGWIAFKYLTREEGQQLADDLWKYNGIKANTEV